MKVLIDADALVTLAKEDDFNHERALATALRLKKAFLYITSFTIPEAATVLSYRISQKAARDFLEDARQRKLLEVSLTANLIKEADEIFLNQRKKGTSWIDCLNVAVYHQNKLDGIFSFDSFYKKMSLKIISK